MDVYKSCSEEYTPTQDVLYYKNENGKYKYKTELYDIPFNLYRKTLYNFNLINIENDDISLKNAKIKWNGKKPTKEIAACFRRYIADMKKKKVELRLYKEENQRPTKKRSQTITSIIPNQTPVENHQRINKSQENMKLIMGELEKINTSLTALHNKQDVFEFQHNEILKLISQLIDVLPQKPDNETISKIFNMQKKVIAIGNASIEDRKNYYEVTLDSIKENKVTMNTLINKVNGILKHLNNEAKTDIIHQFEKFLENETT